MPKTSKPNVKRTMDAIREFYDLQESKYQLVAIEAHLNAHHRDRLHIDVLINRMIYLDKKQKTKTNPDPAIQAEFDALKFLIGEWLG